MEKGMSAVPNSNRLAKYQTLDRFLVSGRTSTINLLLDLVWAILFLSRMIPLYKTVIAKLLLGIAVLHPCYVGRTWQQMLVTGHTYAHTYIHTQISTS